ncbi:MAG: site-specific DNA-methyltransferase [Chloroflexi bacterium]|nr:site-specific DNA-methyltransferase [Chloroflexota bacterium]
MSSLPAPVYTTKLGRAYVGDARSLLSQLDAESVDLVVTSPPFALQRQKEYGNKPQGAYVDWLINICQDVFRVLRTSGSFVLDLGGAYLQGRPVRSLYNYRVLIRLCDELGFRLAEEFFWHNPAKLPSPIEWVNKRKIRVKDSVDTVWWLSKSDYPKADVRRVLTPYSPRMLKLLENPRRFYSPKKRPSGHDIGRRFAGDNGGAIPPNVLDVAFRDADSGNDLPSHFLEIPNTESNSQYLRLCKFANAKAHPARFPEKLPAFFIDFLTDPGDVVLDFFAGSNTTGAAAEKAGRRWIAFELMSGYLAASVFRFLGDVPQADVLALYQNLRNNSEAGVGIHQAFTESRDEGKAHTNLKASVEQRYQGRLPL